MSYVVGVDFGTLSGRAVLVRVSDGAEVASAVHPYASGVITPSPDWALQDPDDYRAVLRNAVPQVLVDIDPVEVIGIATDFTACTVLPVKRDGTPLCELPEFRDRPHSWVKLWKHHAAQPEADRINSLAASMNQPWLARYGGKISSEWQYAKALQLLHEEPEIYAAADRWIEAADWIIWQLCGVETRNVCTAGYKGIHQDGQYPSREFLAALHPGFAGFADDKLAHPLSQLGERAGSLTAQAAAWTGLPEGIAVAVGNVDAHVTAPAARAVKPGSLLAVMGTSTCHVVNGEHLAEVSGMCGVVKGGIAPGLWGFEAGQSGVGDIFAWYTETFGFDHDRLTELAAAQKPGAHGLLALDWNNGNRSVLVDHHLSGVLIGQTLATKPEDIYRALMEATAFGTRIIIESFEASGVPVNDLTAAGGLIRNTFLMQLYADVTGRTVNIVASDQAPALGSAIHAAVAAKAYPDIFAATEAMGSPRAAVYQPDPAAKPVYDKIFAEYRTLHDYFGRGENEVLHRLRAMR
ncbi:MAG TPA: ribulokinase [Candidatus Limnocylindrales bacterium]